MRADILIKINSDPKLKEFINNNSYWYKYLNRNPDLFNNMVQDMKEKYKLTKVIRKMNV